jgi:hypothetical protein
MGSFVEPLVKLYMNIFNMCCIEMCGLAFDQKKEGGYYEGTALILDYNKE